MNFLQRFKGKTSIMDKQGIDGIVKSKALPIEIHNVYNNNNYQQNNIEEPKASYLMRSSAPIMQQGITHEPIVTVTGSKQKKTKIFTNITRENNNQKNTLNSNNNNNNNIHSQLFPRIGQQNSVQPSSSSSTASSIRQFTRGSRYSDSTNIQQQHSIIESLNASLIDRNNNIINNYQKKSYNGVNSLNRNSQDNNSLRNNNNHNYSSMVRSSTLITDRGVNYSMNHDSNDDVKQNNKQSMIQRINNNHLSQTLQVGGQRQSSQHHHQIIPNYNSKNTTASTTGLPHHTHHPQSSQDYYQYNHNNHHLNSYSSMSLTGSYKLPPGVNNIVVPSDYELIAVPKALSQTQALPVNYLRDQIGINQSQDYPSLAQFMLPRAQQSREFSPVVSKSQQLSKSVLKGSSSDKAYNSLQSVGQDKNNQQKTITFTQAAQKQQQQSLLNSAAKNILEWNSTVKGKPQGGVGTAGGQFKYELDLMEEKHRDIIKNLDKIREKRTKK